MLSLLPDPEEYVPSPREQAALRKMEERRRKTSQGLHRFQIALEPWAHNLLVESARYKNESIQTSLLELMKCLAEDNWEIEDRYETVIYWDKDHPKPKIRGWIPIEYFKVLSQPDFQQGEIVEACLMNFIEEIDGRYVFKLFESHDIMAVGFAPILYPPVGWKPKHEYLKARRERRERRGGH